MTTTLIDAWFDRDEAIAQRPQASAEACCLAAALLAHGRGWRADSVAAYDIELACDGAAPQRVRVQTSARDGTVQVSHAGRAHQIAVLAWDAGRLRYRFDGIQRRAVALHIGSDVHLALGADSFVFSEPSAFAQADAGVDASRLRAPVAGVVSQVLVQVGDNVAAGQPLVCIEAMKMEMWLAAPGAACVVALQARVGEQVASGAVIVELAPTTTTTEITA